MPGIDIHFLQVDLSVCWIKNENIK